MSGNGLILGDQVITVISAMRGGFAQKVLEQIAHPEINPLNFREFSGWDNGKCFGRVISRDTGEEREVILKLDTKEGLFLDDQNGHRKFSLKHSCDGRICIVPLPNSYQYRSRRERVDNPLSIANNIIGSWILHGKNWVDRSGQRYYWPYGIDPKRKEDPNFVVVDGAKFNYAMKDIKDYLLFSPHPGTWNNPVAVVPAALGLPFVMHEFTERAGDKDYCVTFFDGKRISPEDQDEIWGPYTQWDSEVFTKIDFGPFRDIAESSASPFNFHIAATLSVFPKGMLASKYILDGIGKTKLLQILQEIARKEPSRFYRLIDEKGYTFRLRELSNENIFYANARNEIRCFSYSDLAENILLTFEELAQIQNNPCFEITRRERVVPDSHFYVVMITLMSLDQENRSYHLSGPDMYKYLTQGPDSRMHQIRNERVLELLVPFFGLTSSDKVELDIFPANSLRLPRINQYNFEPLKWDPSHWRSKKLNF